MTCIIFVVVVDFFVVPRVEPSCVIAEHLALGHTLDLCIRKIRITLIHLLYCF